MNQGRDATRRNRNIGTAKQGLGQDNRLVIPWCGSLVRGNATSDEMINQIRYI
ncbi:MAG: hypothetical protein J2P52_03300 [Blastocatellia bacterium]|nr:hypothetical protein [Blastocatellia bacterium]